MYVNAKDFAPERPSRSLGFKNGGPWKIVRIIDNKAYELDIPKQLKEAGLTPIFHPWKLHLAPDDPFPGQILSEGPPVLISSDSEDPHEEYEVLEVVDCRETRRYGLQYKATFIGNFDEWNSGPPWQKWTDFENAAEKVLEFHRKNPKRPRPPQELVDAAKDQDPE